VTDTIFWAPEEGPDCPRPRTVGAPAATPVINREEWVRTGESHRSPTERATGKVNVELADYLRILRRRWWLVSLGIVLALAGAATATFTQTPKYKACTQILVAGSNGVNAVDEIADRQLASQRAVAYSQIATTAPAIRAATAAAGAGATGVSATADGTSPFLNICATAMAGHAAAAVANAYVTVLPQVVHSLEQGSSAVPARLTTLSPAGAPSMPFTPKPVRNLLIGLVIGVLIGVVAALVRETLDPTYRDSADIERDVEVEVFGVVPEEFSDEQLIAVTRPRSRRAEAYRHVRTNLEFAGPEGAPRSIVITSPVPGEGKTTLSTNLALIASYAGKQVCLVDADLRKPRIAQVMRVDERPGLTDVLSGSAHLESALQVLEGERLTIMASGPVPRSPSELLGSTAMAELIDQLERRFDLVIIDAPPVLPVTDALVIGVNTTGVVLVSRLRTTPRSALRRGIKAVQKVNANLLGIVANAATEPDDKRYGYGYGYLSQNPASKEDLRPVEHLRAASRRTRRTKPSTLKAVEAAAAEECEQRVEST